MESFIFKEAFVALATQQLDTAITFYKALFDIEPRAYISSTYAEFLLPGLKLGIFQPKPQSQSEFISPNSGALSLCFEVKDLEAAIDHLTALGCPPPDGPMTASHGREVYAYDPDGNRLILYQSLELPIA